MSSSCFLGCITYPHRSAPGILQRRHSLLSQECTNLTTQQKKHIDLLPVLIELNGKVGHVLQSLIGEVHLHVDVSLPVTEGA